MSETTGKKATVTCEFPNNKLADEFMRFMCEQGEQDWWAWLDAQGMDDTVMNYQWDKGIIEFSD